MKRIHQLHFVLFIGGVCTRVHRYESQFSMCFRVYECIINLSGARLGEIISENDLITRCSADEDESEM